MEESWKLLLGLEIRLDGKLRAVRKQTGGSGQDV